MPFATGTMKESTFSEKLENLGHRVTAERLVNAERELKRRALQVTDQDVNIVGIHQSALRRLIQKILRMIHHVLIEWSAGCHHHGHRHSAAAPCAPHTLPR